MPKLIIIGHLEMAEALDHGFLFGYTLAVGWSEAGRPNIPTTAAHPLLPWSWKSITKIQLFGKAVNTGTWQPVKDFPVVTDSISVHLGDVKTEATVRYEKASSITWPDPSTSVPVKVELHEDETHSVDPWVAHVIEMSSSPFPIAQHLNLSFAFRAQEDLSGYGSFAAAPVLAKELNLDAELPPLNFQATRSSDGFAVYNQISANHPFDTVAACNIVASPAATVPSGQGIEVRSTSLADWQQEFLLGASKLFSVPDFVRFALSRNTDEKLNPLVPVLVSAGVACLRDIISPGMDSGPRDGFPALQRLLSANPEVGKEVKSSGYNGAFANTDTWTAFLKQTLVGINRLSLWALAARNDDSSNQAIQDPSLYYGQLRRDFSTVLAPIANESKPNTQQSTSSNHKQLMLALWRAMLDKLANAPTSQVANVRSGLPAALEDVSYTSLWLDDTFGMFWKNVLDNSIDAPNPFLIRTRALSKYFVLLRLGLPITAQETPVNPPTIWRDIPKDWMPLGKPLDKWKDAKKLILQWIDAWQVDICSSFEPSSDPIPGSDSRNPLPVHVQYSPFEKDNETAGDVIDLSQQDLFREIRGIGLLVREQNIKNWTAVSLNAAVDLKSNLCLDAPVGFPLRSGYVANLRRGLIAYEGEPLSGGTALDNIDGLHECFESPVKVRPALISADYHPEIRTPQLKYGRKYSFATFSVLNSGILPPALREGADPRAWKSACDHIPGTWKPGETLYQRRTKIGALRILHDDALPNLPAPLPTIPSGTYPRARDINWNSLWKSDPLRPTDPDKLNLALLSPESWTKSSSVPRNSYKFRVRLPEVTWREWSAWGASLPSRNPAGLPDPSHPVIPLDQKTFVAHRADIIEECFNTSLQGKAMPAVDDPCLDRLLYFELFEEAGGKLDLKDKKFLPIPAALGVKGRSLYQASGASVVCLHNGTLTSDLSPNEANQTIMVSLQEGKVAILRIWACLPVEYQLNDPQVQAFQKMFASRILPPEKHPAMKYKGKDYLLVTSYDLLLEAVSTLVPAPSVLFNAFSTSLRLRPTDPSATNVVASFPNPQPGNSITADQQLLFLNVGSVKAQRQSWRWEGRPVPLHPCVLDSTTTDKFSDLDRRWTWEVYGERPDGESVPVLMPVLRVPPVQLNTFDTLLDSGCRYFESSDSLSTASGPTLPAKDLRGSHFRFSIEVTSRYDSLMRLAGLDPVRFAHPDLNDTSIAPPKSRAWKSAYVPSRVTKPAVPKLRLLLPLTEAYGREESESSSLLAVFDSVFYDEVGLGDTLEAEIESVPVETKNLNPRQFAVQAGKDILLRAGADEKPSLETYPADKGAPVKIQLDATQPTTKWSGPIGNYRDFNNRYARFLATSFIIPAPTRPDGKKIDVRGWLANIRFRRVVRTRDFPAPTADSSALKDYAGSAVLQWNSKSYPSCWTDSYWVQFLGSFSKFDGFDLRIANLVPSVNGNSGILTFHARDKSEPVAIRATKVPTFPKSRQLYAVVTQRVFDFRGQYNQELYVATLRQDDDLTSWYSVSRTDALKKLTSDFRVRIIEVAFPTAGAAANQGPADPENLFEALFAFRRVPTQDVAPISGKPVYSPLDATGSILRVSEPANSRTSQGELLKLCEVEEVVK